jgi:hypothetical protein
LPAAVVALLLCAGLAADGCAQPAAERAGAPTQVRLHALFVGNSLTYVNDLPGTLQRFAAEAPLHAALTVHSVMGGGATLADHWSRGEAVRALRELHPDVVVLQGQSVEPLVQPDAFAEHAALLKAEADNVHVETVLFSTWARPAGDPFYRESVSGGSPEVMQMRLDQAYTALAAQLGATLAPVGPAFVRARRDAPVVALLDGTQHPTPAGTYLAAAVFYRVLFHDSPVGSTYLGGLPRSWAAALQRVAAEIPLTPRSPKPAAAARQE